MNTLDKTWIACAKDAASLPAQVLSSDEIGRPLVLEWKGMNILSSDLAAFKRELSDLAAVKLSKTELEFLQSNPAAASRELFLRASLPFLEKGPENADWSAIQETIQTSIKQFYCADLSHFGPELLKPLLNDVYFCAKVIREGEKEPLGYLLFAITPKLPFGHVKVVNFLMRDASLESAESLSILNQEAQKSLMALIFQILPETKRIFLFVRPTDSASIEMYSQMGFEKDENPFQDSSHKIDPQSFVCLDYRTETSDLLQNINERCVAQKF